jgi:hypothetical protein
MSFDPNKPNARYNKAIGSFEEVLESTIENKEAKAKGNTHNKEGHGEGKASETKEWVQGTLDTMAGTAKNNTGYMPSNIEKRADDEAQRGQGNYRRGIDA